VRRASAPSGKAALNADRAAALRVASIVAAQRLMAPEALFRATRGGEAEARARQELAYLLHTACGMSLNRVGAALKRHRTSVSHAVRQIEESLGDGESGRAHRMERLSALAKEAVALGALEDEALAGLVALERS
jgi:chromosomal replication initiation ATPase DnaA